MNSINSRARTHQRKSEARSIGKSGYKNLKLKKKEKKRREPEALKYRKHSRALLGGRGVITAVIRD